MTDYIIRNGGFQKQQMMKEKPKEIKAGTEVIFDKGYVSTLTKGRTYSVIGHFCYLNTYGASGSKFAMWDQFLTIKNDQGYTIKVAKWKFYIVPNDIMEILHQTI